MSSQLDAFLASLDQEGTVESQGVFSVDLARSQELLGNFLFKSPANYLLKLIQSGVAFGAHRIDIQMRKDRLQLSWQIPLGELAPETFAELLDRMLKTMQSPLEKGLDRSVRHLAFGLLASLSLPHHQIVAGFRSQSGGRAVVWRHGQTAPQSVVLPADSSLDFGWTQFAFQILRPAVGALQIVKSWLGAGPLVSATESKILSHACRFCGIPVHLDGRLLNTANPGRVGKAVFSTSLQGFDTVVERTILSTDSCSELLCAPHPVNRAAQVYDYGVSALHLGLGKVTLIQQFRSNRRPGFFPPNAKVSIPIQAQSSWDALLTSGTSDSIVLGTKTVVDGDTGVSSSKTQRLPADLGPWTRPGFAIGEGFGHRSRSVSAHAFLAAPCWAERPESMIVFQSDGVLLAPIFKTFGLQGMLILVAHDAVKTDLSGLQPVIDEDLEPLWSWINEEVEDMYKSARTQVRWAEKFPLGSQTVQQLKNIFQVD